MSEERLWKFRKPEWMNSATFRGAGVYGAGALVSFSLLSVAEHKDWGASRMGSGM